MTEYILGIGHLDEEECRQVMRDIERRMAGLEDAQAALNNELNHLNTIKFQVANRQLEIGKSKKEEKID